MENNSKKGLISLVIVLGLLVMVLSSYLIYDKVLIDNDNTKNNEEINDNKDEINNENKEEANNENKEENENNLTDDDIVYENTIKLAYDKFYQVLGTEVGTIYLNDGEVYYDPVANWKQFGRTKKLELDDKKIGTYGIYEINDGPMVNIFSGYKLDLNDILFVNELYFGNGSMNTSIIFIGNNGKISELYFNGDRDDIEVTLYKNIEGYNNIVNVYQHGNGGSAVLVDKEGNKYNYYGAKYQ